MFIFTLVLFPIIFQNLVNSQVVLTNGTLSFDQWLAPTPAIFKIVIVYNVTNPDVVTTGGQPVLEPLGPYYYREYRERVNVEEVYDQELWFGEKKWYEFDYNTTNKDITNGSAPLDPVKDVFTTFNLAYVGVAYNLSISGTKAQIAGAVAMAKLEHEQTLFMTRSVFNYYHNDFVDNAFTLSSIKLFKFSFSRPSRIVVTISNFLSHPGR